MRIAPLLLTVIFVAAMHCDGSRLPRIDSCRLLESRKHDPICLARPIFRQAGSAATEFQAPGGMAGTDPLTTVQRRGSFVRYFYLGIAARRGSVHGRGDLGRRPAYVSPASYG